MNGSGHELVVLQFNSKHASPLLILAFVPPLSMLVMKHDKSANTNGQCYRTLKIARNFCVHSWPFNLIRSSGKAPADHRCQLSSSIVQTEIIVAGTGTPIPSSQCKASVLPMRMCFALHTNLYSIDESIAYGLGNIIMSITSAKYPLERIVNKWWVEGFIQSFPTKM